jgi:hypothetical protein
MEILGSTVLALWDVTRSAAEWRPCLISGRAGFVNRTFGQHHWTGLGFSYIFPALFFWRPVQDVRCATLPSADPSF